MLNRRAFLFGVLSAALAAPHGAEARMYRVGLLCPSRCDLPGYDVLRESLAGLGWRVGDNLQIDARAASGQMNRLPALAREVVAGKPDLIVTVTPQPARAAKDATSTIPIVFVVVADPVGMGLVKSLAHPGATATGVATLVPGGFVTKQLELFTELLPRAKRIAVIMNPDNDLNRLLVPPEVRVAAANLRVDIDLIEARTPTELGPAIESLVRRRAEGLLIPGDPVLHSPSSREIIAGSKLPTMWLSADIARAQGLISYGPNFPDLFRQAASYIDRILRGANPSELPVMQPNKYDLVINLKTARALGLTIPPSLLLRADQVIE
jgi:putative tryptophan/tyrosine transport system substrate-binding protein